MTNKKIFYAIVASDILSDLGDTLYYLALMDYVLLLSNSNLALAIITISEALPIIFKVLIGNLADRILKKVDTIIFTQLFRFLLYVIVGFVMLFSRALWIVFVVSAINFLSDLAGQLENGLYLPLEVQLVSNEEREQVFATTHSVSSTLNVIFKLGGATLVTLINYQTLAWGNSLTFLVCALFMYCIRSRLRMIGSTPHNNQNFENTISSVKNAFKEIKLIPKLWPLLLSISFLNGLFSITTPLVVSSIAQNKDFIFLNSVTTISLSGVTISIATVIGNIITTTLLKKLSLKFSMMISLAFLPILFTAFVLHNVILFFIVLACLGVASGILTPKFYGFFLSAFPTDKLGILTSSVGTISQLGIVVSQLMFSLLMINTSITTISWIYLCFSILLLIVYLQGTILNNTERKLYHVFNFKFTKN